MAGVQNVIAAILSFISLVLVAIAMATNRWVRFEPDRSTELPGTTTNPIIQNSQSSSLTLNYDLDHFGLWVGCHRETRFRKLTCSYIGSKCYSEICWIRNGDENICQNDRVQAISNCSAYQAVRAMTILGTICLVIGSSILVVSVCVAASKLITTGAVLTALATLFLMIAFAVFQGAIFESGDLDSEADIRWSFNLLRAAWPISLVASIFAFISGPGKQQAAAEFDESE